VTDGAGAAAGTAGVSPLTSAWVQLREICPDSSVNGSQIDRRKLTRLTTPVAGLARSVEPVRTSRGGSAVTANVAEFATCVALHGLSLAITGEVVWPTALVASGRAGASLESSTETTESAAGWWCSTSSTRSCLHSWVRAVARQVTGQTARVAAAACSSSAQAKSWAVSLDVTEALAVVALLGLSGSGVWASVGLVAGLLAYPQSESLPQCRVVFDEQL
jgi:hypothetical protein